MKRGEKSCYHHGNLKQEIIAAALHVLELEGVAKLSLREVSRRAGVSHAAPYRHFRDKEDLLKALVLEGYKMLENSFLSLLSDKTNESETLFLKLQGFVKFGKAHPELHRLIFGHNALMTKDLRLRKVAEASFKGFEKIVAQALPKGKEHTAKIVTLSLWSHAHGVLLLSPNPNLPDGNVCQKSQETCKALLQSLRFSIDSLISQSFGKTWKNPYLY